MAYSQNRFADAVPIMQKAVQLDPGSPLWSMGLALLYLDLGDDSKSVATIELADKRSPGDWYIQLLWAATDLIRRDSAGTVRHAEQSARPVPA